MSKHYKVGTRDGDECKYCGRSWHLVEKESECPCAPKENETVDLGGCMPGAWKCDQCGFVIQLNVLYVKTGAMGADTQTKEMQCPNDRNPMRRLTWREANRDLMILVEDVICAIPPTYYAGHAPAFRVRKLVEHWQKLVVVNQELQEALELARSKLMHHHSAHYRHQDGRCPVCKEEDFEIYQKALNEQECRED